MARLGTRMRWHAHVRMRALRSRAWLSGSGLTQMPRLAEFLWGRGWADQR